MIITTSFRGKRYIKTLTLLAVLLMSVTSPAYAGQVTHPLSAPDMTSIGISEIREDQGVYTKDTIYSLIKYKDSSQQGMYEKARMQIAEAIADKVPAGIVSYFFEHHGAIYIGSWENNGGYTELAVDNDEKPMMPDTVFDDYPCNMYISVADSEYGFLDDYVIHEFGHVLDAKFRITKNPAYNNIIASETAAVVAANKETSVDAGHYSETPEAFAQVCAAYWGGDDTVGSAATLSAAPQILKLIKEFEEK